MTELSIIFAVSNLRRSMPIMPNYRTLSGFTGADPFSTCPASSSHTIESVFIGHSGQTQEDASSGLGSCKYLTVRG